MPASIFYENKKILGFTNAKPEAPIHLLLIPKRHIEWKDKFGEKDLRLLAELIDTARQTAVNYKINEAYKLIFNVGKTGHIPHIHLHILGGWKEEIPMNNI